MRTRIHSKYQYKWFYTIISDINTSLSQMPHKKKVLRYKKVNTIKFIKTYHTRDSIMNIIWFSFANTDSVQILKQLDDLDFSYIATNDSDYKVILETKPDIIIWLWDYTGRDQQELRFESYCTNKFRNSLIDWDNIQKYMLYIPKTRLAYKVWRWMGNWYCNRACFLLSNLIHDSKHWSKIIFIHIPKTASKAPLITQLQYLIRTLKKSTLTSRLLLQ